MKTPKVQSIALLSILFLLIATLSACAGDAEEAFYDNNAPQNPSASPNPYNNYGNNNGPNNTDYSDYGNNNPTGNNGETPDAPPSNPYTDASEDNQATFSIDVDTASYTFARRMLTSGQLPSPHSVRTEEFINFFRYDYEAPTEGAIPFKISTEAAPSPFADGKHLLKVGIKGRDILAADRTPANLIFLVDVSGSMHSSDKLGLVKRSLTVLLEALGPEDTLGIVTYAGADQVVLPPTPVSERGQILDALDSLSSGGGTNGAAGIHTAYEMAQENFVEQGVNRVVLCTDGDFNVGSTGEELIQTVESWKDRNIALSVLGYGSGFNDSFLEELTNRGEGNYAFVDSYNEALRVLGENLVGTLQVIARDVKIQINLNPNIVSRYRLIGYENRDIRDEDFDNDDVDAGEIGSGHNVTAFLELELTEGATTTDLEAQIADVRIRFKLPNDNSSMEVNQPIAIREMHRKSMEASSDFLFAAAVSQFAERLRLSPHASADFSEIHDTASAALGENPLSDRTEFLDLLSTAETLWNQP